MFILLFALANPCFGQLERSVVEGTVTDPQGAFVPGVKVTVTAQETNISVPTTTNRAGYFRVTSLIPGKYHVHFEVSGFSPLDLVDIVVPAGQAVRADATLQLGTTVQTVEVSAATSMVQTAATDFSTTIGTSTIQEVPLAGRDLQQLVLFVPGVVGNGPPGSNFGFNSQFGTFPDPTHLTGSDVSVNGGQTGTNAWYLDGNFNTASGSAEALVVDPSPDAVSEFQAITNGFSAEYGRSGGAVFSTVLKSGANQVHGDLYEYVRNSYFNARNPFTSIGSNGQIIPQDQLRYNNFGGTIGGPIVIPHLYNGKNKSFFFFSYSESILHLNGSDVLTVPTPLMKAGNFSEDPNTAQYGIWNPYSTVGPAPDGTYARSAFGTPVAGSPIGCTGAIGAATAMNPTSADCNFATQIPTNMLSKTAAFFMNSFPNPNYLSPLSNAPLAAGGAYRIASNYLGAVGSSQDSGNISLKVDHQWSDKSRYFGEWLFNPGFYNNYRLPWTGAAFPQSIGFGSVLPMNFANQIIAVGNTYTLNPSTINEFRASFSRQYYTTHPETGGYPNSVTDLTAVQQELAPIGITLWGQTPQPSFQLSGPDGSSIAFGPTAWVSNYTATESYTILDNVTKIIGKHTLRTGFVYRLSHAAEFQGSPTELYWPGPVSGTVNPVTGLGGGGVGLAGFEMGAVMQAVGNNGNAVDTAWNPYVRFGYWGAYLQDDFRVTPKFTLNVGVRYDINESFNSRQQPISRLCYTCIDSFSGLEGTVQYAGQVSGWPRGSNIIPANLNDIGPRFNFAWTPFADRKTVIRGGFDVFFSNAYSSVNSEQSIENENGWKENYFWRGSSTPNCPAFSGQCVAWSLDDVGNKSALLTPVDNGLFPAQSGGFAANEYTGTAESIVKPVHDPMVTTWTLEVQRELPGNMALTVGYVGSHGTHLAGNMWHSWDYVSTANLIKYGSSINNVVPITNYYSGQAASALTQVYGTSELPISSLLVPYPMWTYWGQVEQFNGENVYHSLQVRLQKRYSHGLNFDLAYTWSKNITNALVGGLQATDIDPIHDSGIYSGWTGGRNGAVAGSTGNGYAVGIGSYYQNPDDTRADRAVSSNDIPQVLNFAATYQLPFGVGQKYMNRKNPLNYLVGGWKFIQNFNAESGVPLAIQGPCDALTCRPDLVGNPKAVPGGQNANHWINAAAFLPPYGADQTYWANPVKTDPRWYQFGTAGPVLPSLRSPGYWNFDTSLTKQFHVTEADYFEFRWEMFNALNHQNPGLPNTGYCLPPNPDGSTDAVHQAGCQFGRITNVQTDPRAMEFALKFFF
jgi:hypothetical protein